MYIRFERVLRLNMLLQSNIRWFYAISKLSVANAKPLHIEVTLSLLFTRMYPYFQDLDILIIHEGLLALARMYRRDILVFEDDVNVHRANRHQVY